MTQAGGMNDPDEAGRPWFEWDDGPTGTGAEYETLVEARPPPSAALPSPASSVVDPRKIAAIARARHFQWRPRDRQP